MERCDAQPVRLARVHPVREKKLGQSASLCRV
jgi:hypothetical protein